MCATVAASLFPHSVSAQTRIRERVEILPANLPVHTKDSAIAPLGLAETSNATIRFEAQWSEPAMGLRLMPGGPEIDTTVYGEFPIVSYVKAHALRGGYSMYSQVTVPGSWCDATIRHSIFLNDVLVAETTDTRRYYWQVGYVNAGTWISYQYLPPLHLDLHMIPDTVLHGNTVQVIVVAEDSSHLEFALGPTEKVNISIDSTRFGGFLNVAGQRVPWVDQAYYSDARAGRIRFIADGDAPLNTTRTLVRSFGTGLNGAGELYVAPSGGSFRISVNPDTLTHGDTAIVTITALDGQGQEMALAGTTPLNVSIDSTQYGAFINPAGQRVPSPLTGILYSDTGILYSDARAGKVKFVADGLKPASLPLPASRLIVSSTELHGADTMYFNARVLTLETGRDTLRPLRDADNLGPRNARVLDFGSVDTTRIELALSDLLDRPLSGRMISVRCSAVDTSGGHDHQMSHRGTRPRGRFRTPGGDTVETFSGQTNAHGKIILTYLSSGIGGIDSLEAVLTGECDSVRHTITLLVRGLQLLTIGDHYVLTGAYPSPGVNSEHGTNHFGRPGVVQSIRDLSDSVHSKYSRSLRVNDMSLSHGGPFDIKNQWNTPHQKHREGSSVDIGVFLSDMTTRLSDKYLEALLKVPTMAGSVQGEGPVVNGVIVVDHYHLTFQ